MVTKNAALMQALFCKKALKINDLYMYGMFRYELYEYWCSVVGSFAGCHLDGFRKEKETPLDRNHKLGDQFRKKAKARSSEENRWIIVSYLSN